LHFKRGNNREAIEAWRPILERNPEAVGLQLTAAEFFAALGRALLDDGQPAAAKPFLERALQLTPTAGTRNTLAEACEQLGDSRQAMELWQQVVASAPADQSALEGLARWALERRDADDARRWLGPLLDREDLKSSTAYLMQRAALLEGDRDSAAQWDARVQILRQREKKLSALDQALREAPQSFWARAVRAHRFASEGNARQALLLAEELLEQAPDEPFVQQLVGALRNHESLPSFDMIPYNQF
jgi:tetratricopeptide (TPR) repeat protein